MLKNKLLFIGLLSLALVCGMALMSCPGSDTEPWQEVQGEPPTLQGTSQIDGRTFNRGTQKTNASDAIPGSAELRSSEVDENDQATYSKPNPIFNMRRSPTTADVKYSVTSSIDDVPTTYGAAPLRLSNGDVLWIQVTDKGLSNYYVIRITVKYSPVSVFAIKSHPASRQSTLADWETDPIPLTVAMQEAYNGYRYQWYSNTENSNVGGTALDEEEEQGASYTPDNITQNGDYYYYVKVSISGETAADPDETLTSNPALIRIVASIAAAPTEFTIGETRLNYVRGVGGTGSFMFRIGSNADASPDADVNYIDLLMGTLGANNLRIMVQDDYLNYIQNTVQSRNSTQYFHNAEKNFFPVIRRVNEAGGYVFANPWTGPAYLKNLDNEIAYPGYWLKSSTAGGSEMKTEPNGGFLRTTGPAYVDYATHFRNFLTWLNNNDAPIFALGILNEPDFGGGANYEGMGMSPDVMRNWFRVVGHFPTQVADRDSATNNARGSLYEDIIPGYGGGRPTHHVMSMSGDPMGGNLTTQFSPSYNDTGENGANNVVEIWGRHYYGSADRFTPVAGTSSHTATKTNTTLWEDRPQLGNYEGPYEGESLAVSPQMYAPGSQAGNIKREVWQTEHDFNYNSQSVNATNTVSTYWNSAFAAMNDIDWCLRVIGESVFSWWFSSSYSGFVTSWHPATGGTNVAWGPYTITPRGRAFAHYGRYVNETWLLDMERTKGTIAFNNYSGFDAGSKTPKISAFEDVNGEYISIVMFTPINSTNTSNPDSSSTSGAIGSGFGAGGLNGSNVLTTGTNVGLIDVVLPSGFVGTSATAIRSYGNSAGQYWNDEPVFITPDGTTVQVNLPAGNIISIKVMGNWTGGGRYFATGLDRRVRPYDRYQNNEMTGPIMVEGMNPPPER